MRINQLILQSQILLLVELVLTSLALSFSLMLDCILQLQIL